MTSNDIAAFKYARMKLFSYVVARDYGFAPNPFFGICTLATCKPRIRKTASMGDWIVGTGSKSKGRQRCLVFVMRVTEAITFNEYWENEQYRQKKPNLSGSMKQAYGDNIYFKVTTGQWLQQDSHHSLLNGMPNKHNIKNDTQTDRVLLSTKYAYWGGSGPEIPKQIRNCNGFDICAKRNHKCVFPEELVNNFLTWFCSLDTNGFLGEPLDWYATP